MTDNDKCCPPPKEVQDFLFKQATISQVCEEFHNIPTNCSLVAADGKRGLLYVGHENKLIIVKPEIDSNPEWKFELNLLDKICQIGLSCDCSLLALTFDGSTALIYDTTPIQKHKLNLLHKIRLSASGQDVTVSDLKWNPAIPEILCSITSDHTIACFQVSKDKTSNVQIIGMEKAPGLEALCVSWSPKGKQIVVGCKNGDIVQLKPELKLARHLSAPNPSEGMIISILWVSNYQFCACFFHSVEHRISVMIVDAPKGVTAPRYTNYEDVTFGSGSLDICYYFEHITEWGIIVAASTHSSEVAVLGTSDNGVTWNLWQLMDDSTAQLPLNRKKKIENYPVGMAIDKSITQKLPWDSENTLPNPVPVLRILVTSGQLCSFHMVNLKENSAAICTSPTEFISPPELPRSNNDPSEVSFHLSTGATSTPRIKQNISETQVDKPKLTTNVFGNASNSVFSFLAPGNRALPQIIPQTEIQNVGPTDLTDLKTNTNVDQGDGKTNLFQQDKVQTTFATQADEQLKKTKQILQPVNIQSEPKSIGLSLKPDNKIEFKNVVAPVPFQTELKLVKEITKEPVQQHLDEIKSVAKEIPTYDDGICLRAYYEEQSRFEKELKSRLDLPSWNCGTEEDRKTLVKKSIEIDEFLRELKETTSSLANDIAYLKALLLQSFAWIEETKSKNSASTSANNRNSVEGNKLADLQRLYYYTQSQLIQATKVLDLEWAEHNDRKLSRMKIPSLEMIYQSLVRYTQIITQEKKNLEELTKKWCNIGRGNNTFASLDRSMASLNLSQSSNAQLNDTAINLRCKLIASSTRNFSREKQTKLRDLLSESAPRIIRAVRPTAVQDRLEATLSSLTSLKSAEASVKISKATKPAASKLPTDPAKLQAQTSLSSLNSLVSGISSEASSLSKSPCSVAPFSSLKTKSVQSKPKEIAPQLQVQVTLSAPKASMQPQKESPVFTKPSISGVPVAVTVPTSKFSGFSIPTTTPPSFASVPKLDASIPFKFSTKSTEQPNAEASLDFSSLSFDVRNPSGVPSLFGKPPPAVTAAISKVTSGPTLTTSGTLATPSLSVITTATSSPLIAPASVFGTSSMFGALSSSSTPSLTFKLPPVATTATSGGGLTMTSTTTATMPAIPFGNVSSMASPSPPCFAGILSSTASLSFGSPTTATSIAPAFSKSFAAPTSNIFGNTTSTSIFSKTDSGPSIASTTSGSSIFGNTVATASGIPTFGNQTTLSCTSGNSFFNLKATTMATTSVLYNTSSSPSLPTFATANATTPKNSVFEMSNPTQNSGSLVFGSGTTTPSSGTSVFGSNSTTQNSGTSIFRSNSTTQSSGTSVFGSSSTTQSSSTSVFGNVNTTQSSGTSVFGNVNATQSNGTSVFGNVNTTQSSGTSIFGSSSTTQSSGTSVFGSSGTTQTSNSSVFGGGNASQSNSPLVFGIKSTTHSNGTSVFGGSSTAPSSTSVFGNSTSTIASPLYRAAVPITTIMSTMTTLTTTTMTTMTTTTTTATTTTTNPTVFGSPVTPGTGSIFSGGAAAAGSTIFNSNTTPSTSTFGSGNSQATTGSIFGTGTTNTSGSIFGTPGTIVGNSMFGGGTSSPGGMMGTPSVFGQPSAFGTKSMFGAPATDFGSAKTGFTTGFSSPPAFGATTGAVFGSQPILGTGSTLASTSPNKVFGSSTFEALGAQSGGLSFDSLAQKTPGTEKPQAFQGSSSFSSWR